MKERERKREETTKEEKCMPFGWTLGKGNKKKKPKEEKRHEFKHLGIVPRDVSTSERGHGRMGRKMSLLEWKGCSLETRFDHHHHYPRSRWAVVKRRHRERRRAPALAGETGETS
jgi:hypothetical protein